MYIQFDKVDNELQNSIFVGEKWSKMTIETRNAYYKKVIDEIENHRWRGKQADNYQLYVFPRIIGCVYVTWDYDKTREYEKPIQVGNYHVLPNYLIIKSVEDLITQVEFQQVENKAKLLKSEIIDVLETHYKDKIVSNIEKGIHLPQPLWEELKYYSLYYNDNNSRIFKIERA